MHLARLILAATALAVFLFLPGPSGIPEASAAPPPNHDFDSASYEVGDPPANNHFPDDAYDVGTPPANHDFETGDLTGWTVDFGTATVKSGGASGYYVELSRSTRIRSSDFTVPTDAQTLTFQFSRILGTGTLTIDILDAATNSTLGIYFFKPYGTDWTHGGIPVESEWAGETVYIRVYASWYMRTIGLDDISVMRHVQDNWTILEDPVTPYTNVPYLGWDAEHANYLVMPPRSQIESAEFTIHEDAQEITNLYSIVDASVNFSVKLVFDTHTANLFNGTCSNTEPTSWTIRRTTIALMDQGESAYLRITTGAQCDFDDWGSLHLDMAGFQNVILPEWIVDAVTDASHIPVERVGEGPWGPHARVGWGPNLTSQPFTVTDVFVLYKRRCETTTAAAYGIMKVLTGPDEGALIGSNTNLCSSPGQTEWHTSGFFWAEPPLCEPHTLPCNQVFGQQVEVYFITGSLDDTDIDRVRLDEVAFNLWF